MSYVTTISEFGIQFSDTQRLYNIRVYHTHGPAANTLNGQRNAAAIARNGAQRLAHNDAK